MNSRNDTLWQAILTVSTILENNTIPYTIEGAAALFVQNMDLNDITSVDFSIQWDLFDNAYDLFQPYETTDIIKHKGQNQNQFYFKIEGIRVNMACYFNHVVAADPYRVTVEASGIRLWVMSPDYYLEHFTNEDNKVKAIKTYLRHLQEKNTEQNEEAWNQETYDAWLKRFGTPQEAAAKIKENPEGRLSSIYHHLGSLSDRKVINLLGSHGSKAVAMALLGAKAAVVDLSAENAKYASELAQAAGVDLRYIVSDVLKLPDEELTGEYGLVLMELGILHYFVDLEPLADVVQKLLQQGGRLILQDFHPVSTKLITSSGKKHKVIGNYFDKSIEVRDVAYSKHLSGDHGLLKKVYLRKWTLGEIVTAFAKAGLMIKKLEESPNTKRHDIGIPKTFILVAEKIN
ncbi:methyltransferase family protein [Scopulibacillus darangshiensis]|uniref:Methyltransferase family protein n=1 Tax=Scopulibacillus darangshiensis TaxID=442528 RepID=A0A4R2P258_9BACL|nr:class I SAM-dependent methyltransferase [Scopulibacillus darangshiensis]TCP28702.1 methyltransferase family protein [Scopulibacillus darangshiensis]